jgi:hypothetical protein
MTHCWSRENGQEVFVKRKRLLLVAGAVSLFVIVGLFLAIAWWHYASRPSVVPVEGIVLLDGKPLNKVAVRFIPSVEYGPDYIAYGVTDEHGRFQLTCNKQSGACAGENLVLILETPPPQLPRDPQGHPHAENYYKSLGGRPLPPQYANAGTSTLTVKVSADRTDYKIELQR